MAAVLLFNAALAIRAGLAASFTSSVNTCFFTITQQPIIAIRIVTASPYTRAAVTDPPVRAIFVAQTYLPAKAVLASLGSCARCLSVARLEAITVDAGIRWNGTISIRVAGWRKFQRPNLAGLAYHLLALPIGTLKTPKAVFITVTRPHAKRIITGLTVVAFKLTSIVPTLLARATVIIIAALLAAIAVAGIVAAVLAAFPATGAVGIGSYRA